MKYEKIISAEFIERPNRFIARVSHGGEELCTHVKNTGRCRELLVPGARVILSVSDNPNRKTATDLVAVYKGDRLINMDSQAPNLAAGEALPQILGDVTKLCPEKVYGDSRVDFYAERSDSRMFIEVKGVTLERDGAVLFPDAPTERGVKHLVNLEKCVRDGYRAAVLFVIQMKGATYFTPNRETHPEFADALIHAAKNGVEILAYDCDVTENSMTIAAPVEVRL